MLSTALEQERLHLAGRLLSEIERRHGLPHPIQRELHPVIMETDSTRGRVWLALSGTGRLGKIEGGTH